MVPSSGHARMHCAGRRWNERSRALEVAVVSLLALLGQAAASSESTDSRLSATLVGSLEAGATGRLAVRWEGPPGILLDLWVDLDGDGVPASHELLAEGRPLTPGIEVVSFDLPPGVPVVPEPTVWVRARAGAWCDTAATVAVTAGAQNRDVCAWQPGFHLAGLNGQVHAMTVFDGASGPALLVGGEFTTAGDQVVNRIASWDGSAWSALTGPAGTGVNGGVYALAVFDDGSSPALYVGGRFDTAGGVAVNNIARWDGSHWSDLGGGAVGGSPYHPPAVRALAVFDDGSSPALYAGGRFDTAGGVWVNNVARWSGTTWSALSGPSGVGVSDSGNTVNALAVFNDGSGPALYAGGLFGRAGGLVAFNIARWDGSVWSVLAGIGVTGGGVNALTVLDDGSGPALYLGGAFDAAGGITVNRVARWDGSVWCPLSGPSGIGVSGDVRAFTLFDDGGGTALYAGGNFWHAGGVTVNNIARWDGSAWSALSGPSGTGVNGEGIRALAVFDDGTGVLLYAGGELDSAGGVTANEIAAWDGSGWIAVSGSPGTGVDGDVDALVVYDDGTGPALYVGGGFETAGGVVVNNVARWDGSGWSALSGASGTGTSGGGGVRALAAFDDGSGPALYVGGQFWEAGGVAVSGIARWDGNTWTALGSGMEGSNQRVLALAVYDDGTGAALYAGGEFDTAGGVTVNNVARWDGASWSGLSGPSATGVGSYNVSALAVFDDGSGPALYAGGWFETAGGVPVNHVARWNGSGWSDVGGGVGIVSPWDPAVRALAVFNNGAGPALCAGGYFDTAGDVTVNGIARWDGSAWSALVGPAGTGVDGLVAALTVSDDGSGPALFAGGTFDTAGGVTVNNVARWDGASWSGLSGPSATGVGSYGVSALAVFDDGSGPALYAGGGFETAGGLASNGIAAWRCFFEIFADGFESGDTSAWSATVP